MCNFSRRNKWFVSFLCHSFTLWNIFIRSFRYFQYKKPMKFFKNFTWFSKCFLIFDSTVFYDSIWAEMAFKETFLIIRSKNYLSQIDRKKIKDGQTKLQTFFYKVEIVWLYEFHHSSKDVRKSHAQNLASNFENFDAEKFLDYLIIRNLLVVRDDWFQNSDHFRESEKFCILIHGRLVMKTVVKI